MGKVARAFSLLVGTFSIITGLTAAAAAATTDDSAVLESFFKEYLDEHLRQRPLEATQLGDHRYDDRLEDLSRSSRERWLAHARKTLAELPKRVDYRKLSRSTQIDYEIFRQHLVQ